MSESITRYYNKSTLSTIKRSINNKLMTLKAYPFSRFYNYLSFRLQKRIKPTRTFAFPVKVNIDVTSVCDSNCQLCPTGLRYKHSHGYMSFEKFKQIIDTVKNKVYIVSLHSWGEPVLHKEIVKMVEYCSKYYMRTIISSNLHKYNESIYEGLFKAGLSELTLSLHGISQESYAAYRPGFDYKKNLNNLEKVVNLREKLKAQKTQIVLSFVVTAFNEHELKFIDEFCASNRIDAAIIYAASLNLRFLLKDENLNDLNLADDEKKGIIRNHINKWQARNPQFQREMHKKLYDDPMLLVSSKLLQHCMDPWQTIYINWEGVVSPCCGSYDYNKDSFGNVFKEDIYQLWNNEKYLNSRLRLKKKSHHLDTMCTTCIGGQY